MTAVKEIAADLFCLETAVGKDRNFNYLVRRKQGNILVHGVDSKRARALDAALAPLGGVKYQLMCHWHEAKHPALKWYADRAVEVYAPEAEVAAITRMLGGVTVKPTIHRKRLWSEFVPHLVSGHSPGCTVYQWRDLLFGGDFMKRRGPDDWFSYFARPHVEAGLQGYQRVRELNLKHWLPLKSREPHDPPHDFSTLAVDQAETKIRKKWKLPAREVSTDARGRTASKRQTRATRTRT